MGRAHCRTSLHTKLLLQQEKPVGATTFPCNQGSLQRQTAIAQPKALGTQGDHGHLPAIIICPNLDSVHSPPPPSHSPSHALMGTHTTTAFLDRPGHLRPALLRPRPALPIGSVVITAFLALCGAPRASRGGKNDPVLTQGSTYAIQKGLKPWG